VNVYVFTAEDNPLVGVWHEEARFLGNDDGEVAPDQMIGSCASKPTVPSVLPGCLSRSTRITGACTRTTARWVR